MSKWHPVVNANACCRGPVLRLGTPAAPSSSTPKAIECPKNPRPHLTTALVFTSPPSFFNPLSVTTRLPLRCSFILRSPLGRSSHDPRSARIAPSALRRRLRPLPIPRPSTPPASECIERRLQWLLAAARRRTSSVSTTASARRLARAPLASSLRAPTCSTNSRSPSSSSRARATLPNCAMNIARTRSLWAAVSQSSLSYPQRRRVALSPVGGCIDRSTTLTKTFDIWHIEPKTHWKRSRRCTSLRSPFPSCPWNSSLSSRLAVIAPDVIDPPVMRVLPLLSPSPCSRTFL